MSHILIVDDHADNLYYLEVLLTSHGYTVESADNGIVALQLARQRLPDLVISDLLMPQMDGFTLLRIWKNDPRLKLIPFVVYTATYTSAEDQQLTMKMGADGFMLKPAEPEDLLNCIAKVLARMQQNTPATRVAIGDQQDLLTLYNETLIRKLEQKTLQQEQTNQALHRELHERRETERALRKSEARLLDAQQVANIGSWETDILTGQVEWSAQLFRIFETDSQHFKGNHQSFLDFVHPDDRERVDQAFQDSQRSTDVQLIQHRVLLDEDRVKHVEERWQVYHDACGQPIRALGTCRDISKRVLAEQEIRRTADLLQAVIDGTTDAIFVKDRDGRYLLANRGTADLLGVPAEQIIGMDDTALFNAEDAQLIRRHDLQAMESNQVQSLEETVHTNGVLRSFIALKAPYRDGKGDVVGVLGISRDISERQQMELKLRQTLRDLDARNRVLRDFAFVASHDLREPLRKIRAFADILRSRYSAELQPAARDYLERMNQTAARMQVLIDDVLTYSRVTGSKNPTQDIDLTAICRDVLTDLEESIHGSGAQIKVSALPFIKADATQMRQLFQNLLSNALKFRAAGRTPEISVQCQPIALPQGPGIRLQFTDNGIGFASEFANRIFEPFQRLHSRTEFDGTGIGLAIVNRIVERHHGTIQAESEPGQGARFIIELPCSQPVESGEAFNLA